MNRGKAERGKVRGLLTDNKDSGVVQKGREKGIDGATSNLDGAYVVSILQGIEMWPMSIAHLANTTAKQSVTIRMVDMPAIIRGDDFGLDTWQLGNTRETPDEEVLIGGRILQSLRIVDKKLLSHA